MTPVADDGSCELESQLAELMQDKKLRGVVTGFYALWQRIKPQGPRTLGTELYHCVDQEEGIYEFIKGPLRLLCFEAEGSVVVCSHVFRKESQKTRNKDKSPAIALKRMYQNAKARGQVTIIDGDE